MSDPDPRGVPVPRPRGRPRVAEPGSAVMTWLPASAHDRLIELAKREEASISATVRALIVLQLQK